MLAYQFNLERYNMNQQSGDPPEATDTSLFIEESFNYLTRTNLANGEVGMIYTLDRILYDAFMNST